ncbi:phosphatidylinositol 4-phosphate 5-kinase 8 [Pelomyxa schiedti]|nr:phosphatidylinositol 4-phosphate 5-kinase 8 [Pelomyxa schiedti]
MWGWFARSAAPAAATTTDAPTQPRSSTNKAVSYNGETKDGVRHGRGLVRWDDGKTYEGEWHNGEYDGWGVARWPGGGWFEGLWSGGGCTRGAYHCSNGVDVFEGEWAWNATARTYQVQGWGVQRRVVSGRGTDRDREGGGATTTVETVYEGEWEKHQWHGCGTWHSPETGDMYHGQFDHGKRSGTGRALFGVNDGQGGGSYVGAWKDGKFHGRGVRIWENGDKYEGDWECGKEHGSGTKTCACDGTSMVGVWEMGVIRSGTKKWPNGDEFTGNFTLPGGGWKGTATFPCDSLFSNRKIALVGTVQGNVFKETGGGGMCCHIGYCNIQLEEKVKMLESDRKQHKHTLQHIQHGTWVQSDQMENRCFMKDVAVTLETRNITFHESFCSQCPLDKVVRMTVEKRFGVDENQQVVSLVGATKEEPISGTLTLSQLYSLPPHATTSPSGKQVEHAITAVAQLKVRMKPVMEIKESELSHISTLGHGCWGTVYRCLHAPSSTEVAVKKLFEVIASDHNIAKFKLEAEITRELRHPNIVRCLGICTGSGGSGHLQIVSELMCCSLRQLLELIKGEKSKKQLSFREVAAIALGVAKGMDTLHRQNIMHRDLSSNNVLFDSKGTPKICDFGVSRGMNTLAISNRTIGPGTPIHMAPQMSTSHYSIQGDMWGFGVLLAEMINCDIVDSTFDKLPLRSQVTFMEDQMNSLSAPDVEEVRRLCRESSESAVAHCLSRRNACLDVVNRRTHSPDALAQVQILAAADLMFLVVRSCLSILERDRIPFSVIALLLRCCCTSATIHEIESQQTPTTRTAFGTVTVTDDQVTNSIAQWLSSLSPFIHRLVAVSTTTSTPSLSSH